MEKTHNVSDVVVGTSVRPSVCLSRLRGGGGGGGGGLSQKRFSNCSSFLACSFFGMGQNVILSTKCNFVHKM